MIDVVHFDDHLFDLWSVLVLDTREGIQLALSHVDFEEIDSSKSMLPHDADRVSTLQATAPPGRIIWTGCRGSASQGGKGQADGADKPTEPTYLVCPLENQPGSSLPSVRPRTRSRKPWRWDSMQR